MQMGAYSLRLITADRREENNYIARRVTLRIEHDGHFVTDLTPELRYYPVRNMQTAQAALYSTPLRDIYVVLGESNYSADGKQASLGLRMYVTPGQQLLWAGFLLAGLGGFIGLCSALRRREDL
jgi:cytochrome c-type biogenesis protein CcmF